MDSKTDEQKVVKTLDKILKILNKSNMNIPELIILYGNLGYHIGASIAGFQGGIGPTIEQLKQEYYSNPTIDTGLMLQGLLISNWESDFIKNSKLSKFYHENKKGDTK